MDHLQVNSCVNDIFQDLQEFPRSWSPVADVGDVVYVVDDEDDVASDVRFDRFEDVSFLEDAVI